VGIHRYKSAGGLSRARILRGAQHEPPSFHAELELGVSPSVHHSAVYVLPLYDAVLPPVYTVLADQAAHPPLLGGGVAPPDGAGAGASEPPDGAGAGGAGASPPEPRTVCAQSPLAFGYCHTCAGSA
jgi:hypothetical protein